MECYLAFAQCGVQYGNGIMRSFLGAACWLLIGQSVGRSNSRLSRY